MLFRIRDIFQDKRVDVEVFSDLLYGIQLMKTLDVYYMTAGVSLNGKHSSIVSTSFS